MYKALRSFKVKADNGYRMVKPGDLIPEAAGWKNPKAYIDRGWICLEGDSPKDKQESARSEIVRVSTQTPSSDPVPDTVPAARPISHLREVPSESKTSFSKKDLRQKSGSEIKKLASSMEIDSSQTKNDLIVAILGAQ